MDFSSFLYTHFNFHWTFALFSSALKSVHFKHKSEVTLPLVLLQFDEISQSLNSASTSPRVIVELLEVINWVWSMNKSLLWLHLHNVAFLIKICLINRVWCFFKGISIKLSLIYWHQIEVLFNWKILVKYHSIQALPKSIHHWFLLYFFEFNLIEWRIEKDLLQSLKIFWVF